MRLTPLCSASAMAQGLVTTRADLLPKDVRLDVKVKDLRARRVFSPDTGVINNVDGGFGDDDDGDVSKGGESGGGDVIKVDGGGGGVCLICDDDMAIAAQDTNNMTIKSILLAEKLTGSNFTNWYRNLMIVLRYEKNIKFVELSIGPAPDTETVNPDTIDKYYESVNLEQEVACLMLSIKAFHAYKQETRSVSKLLSLEDEKLLGHFGMPRLCIPKKAETPAVLAIREGKIQKDRKKPQEAKGKDKGKNKLAYAPKAKIPPPPKRDNPVKDFICHHCKEGLIGSRKLKHGALRLYMGNKMCATVEAIRSFDLILPSGLIIVLDNCHFAPTVTRGVLSISRLVNNGIQSIEVLKWDQQVVSELVALRNLLEDMDQDSAHMVAASKVSMLKPGEFELWRMMIEQYIKMIDYALWEVIENGAT
ncbi:hypothetical protein Tco_0877584 [Tanacetum coccineum]|uniref:Retrotransposon Copia-like N-terminal domain-containing protein n=1 Tax=Tanacetum coccineum TaxID=301880 RepID=A0ABQ5BWZ9_9ASTR